MLTKNEELDALNREFNKPDSTMRVDTFSARLAQINARAPDPAPKAIAQGSANDRVATVGLLSQTLKIIADDVNLGIDKKLTPLTARLIALETRSDGVTIVSDGVSIAAVADAVDKLTRTMEQPVKPVYDKAGKLIGAEREPVDKKISPLTDVDERILALARRVVELESRPVGMKYCGVWDAKDSYTEHEMVTLSGSLWACRDATRSRPGTDETWQLCVKKGRVG